MRGPVPQPMKSTAASAASSAASNAASAATADGGVSSDAADSKSASEPPLGATAPNPDAQRTTKSDAAVDVASSRAAAAVSPGGKTSNSSADGSEENNSTERSLANTPEGSSSSSNARKLWLVVFDDGDAEEYELSDCAQLVRWHSDRDDFEDYVLAHHYGRGGNGSYGRSNGGSYGGRGPKASRLDALSVDAALSLKTTPIFLKQENPKKLNTKSWKRCVSCVYFLTMLYGLKGPRDTCGCNSFCFAVLQVRNLQSSHYRGGIPESRRLKSRREIRLPALVPRRGGFGDGQQAVGGAHRGAQWRRLERRRQRRRQQPTRRKWRKQPRQWRKWWRRGDWSRKWRSRQLRICSCNDDNGAATRKLITIRIKNRVAPASKVAGAVTPVSLLSAMQHQRHPLDGWHNK